MPHTLIIGAGLSGLYTADMLLKLGDTVTLLEARDRAGGRILGMPGQSERSDFDLGPAWIWPQHTRMQGLVRNLGLTLFPQHSTGEIMVEFGGQAPSRRAHYPMHAGALRVEGGLSSLVNAMTDRITNRVNLCYGARVTSLVQTGHKIVVHYATGAVTRTVETDRVILALPPRLAATLNWSPGLPRSLAERMAATPTWMASHAKFLAIYDTPFWRSDGLSGDAISERGPLAQIHDAGPADCRCGALFGFFGLSPRGRAARDEAALKAASIDQFARLFGPRAAKPKTVYLKDWSSDAETATQADLAPLLHHPRYGLPVSPTGVWSDRVFLAGTEAAHTQGGYLEGALVSAEEAVSQLVQAAA